MIQHIKRNWGLMLLALLIAMTLHIIVVEPASSSDIWCSPTGTLVCSDDPDKINGKAIKIETGLDDYERYTPADTSKPSWLRGLIQAQTHNDTVAATGVPCLIVYDAFGVGRKVCP